MKRPLTLLIATLLLLAPGIVFLVANKSTEPIELGHFIVNYLYMGAPHILVTTLALRFTSVRESLLVTLLLLNVALVAFTLWIHLAVPGREAGLAWVIYLPVSAAVLLLLAAAAAIDRQRRKPTSGASQ